MSTLVLSFACGDDGGAGEGRTTGTETVGAAEDQGDERGDSDGNSADSDSGDAEASGDGDSADSGDGDSADSGDGNTGDGDGDSGDGDSGDGDSGDGGSGDGGGDSDDEDSGDGGGDSGDGDSGDADSGDADEGAAGDADVDSGSEGEDEDEDDEDEDEDDEDEDEDDDEDDGGGVGQFGVIPCGNKIYECGDGQDNDGDGLVDLDDPECTTPCDDNEAYFKTDLPGQNNDCKGDCYFDGNSGGGDDQCEWHLKCDPENPGAQIGCEYDPWLEEFGMCTMETPPECIDFCVPLVPNGCDCFGCCWIVDRFVYLDGAECKLDTLDDCESCTWSQECNNPCEGPCEVCVGETAGDLGPECMEPACPDQLDSCSQQADCPLGEFCQTGCCVPVLPQ